jgi:hypothetical protein
VEIIRYITVNLLLFLSWYALLFRLKGTLSFSDRLLGVFLLCLAQIIASQMVLGVIMKQLFATPLFLLNVSISSIVLFATLPGRTGEILTEVKHESARFLHILRGDRLLICIFSLFTLLVSWLVFLGYLFPSYAWDSLYYHLPMVGQIMQSGAIQENPTPSFIQQYMNIFSKNINLFFLWNIIFLKSAIVTDLSQLVFSLMGVLAVYSMAVKIKIQEKYALYASILFFFTPVLILQSTTNYVDIAVSMLLLISVNFLLYDDLESLENSSPAKSRNVPILLSGLAAGILLGSKPTGPLFMLLLSLAIMTREFLKYIRSTGISAGPGRYSLMKGFRTYLFFFAAPALIIGGYWYIRNWILHANPVYYMDITVLNITLMEGLQSSWVEPAPAIIESLGYFARPFHVWLEKVSYYLYDSRLSGFGPLWFILYLPSMVFSVIYALSRKQYHFLFIALILTVTFLVHPRNWTTRYVIFAVGLGALSFGLACEYFRKRETALRGIALLLAVYTLFSANSPCIMPEKIREFSLLPPEKRTLTRLKPFNIDTKVRNEYGYWMWIEENIRSGDTLAYTFESQELDTSKPFFPAPLWNREFSNRVIYVKAGSYKTWLKKLYEKSASYVLIRTGSAEDQWVRVVQNTPYWMGVTERFQVVYSDDLYKILQFRGANERAS